MCFLLIDVVVFSFLSCFFLGFCRFSFDGDCDYDWCTDDGFCSSEHAILQLSTVSLQQMVLFGQNPSQGTLLKASQFLAEELPIRLSHRVKELDELPDRLNEMENIKRVKEWYAESFQVSVVVRRQLDLGNGARKTDDDDERR
jgi:hypothetical protein